MIHDQVISYDGTEIELYFIITIILLYMIIVLAWLWNHIVHPKVITEYNLSEYN